MSNLIKEKIDGLWAGSLFKILPVWVMPNWFTFGRLALIPFILWLAAAGQFGWMLVLFLFAAVSDTIDGSLARYRRQTSALGMFLDPLADRALVFLLALFLAYHYPEPMLLLAMVIFELLVLLSGALFSIFLPHAVSLGADAWGKAKMIFQVAGLVAVMIFLLWPIGLFFIISELILAGAIVLQVISFLSYAWRIVRA